MKVLRMACHAARVIRQRHKADSGTSECEISPEQRKCLETAFEAADKNGDGILSVDEYYEIFQAHGLTIGKAWFNIVNTKRDKVHSSDKPEILFKLIDHDLNF